jgi:hypothetical protein
MPLDLRLVTWNLQGDQNRSKRHSLGSRVGFALIIAGLLALGAAIGTAAVSSSDRHVAAVSAATTRAHRNAPPTSAAPASRGDAADDDYVEELSRVVGGEPSIPFEAARMTHALAR